MTTKSTASHHHVSHAHTNGSAAEPPADHTATPAEAPAPPAPTETLSASAGPGTPPTGSGASVALLAPPPPLSLIPLPPSNYIADSGTSYRGLVPAKAELVALPLAIADLRKFANYGAVLGATVPSYAEIVQLFDIANAWSSMRTVTSAWDAYCRDQEGIAWTMMRSANNRLRPAFALAATGDGSLSTTYPGLAALLGMKKSLARKGVSTKRLNKQAVAEGKAPVHGKSGKRRQRAAEKAALAAAQGHATVPGAVTTTTPAVTNGTNGAAR